MAKKGALSTKTPKAFEYIYITTWGLMPFVYKIAEESYLDSGLYPRMMLVAASLLAIMIALFSKKTKPLPLHITTLSIGIFVFWHLASFSVAFSSAEVWIAFARNLLMLGYLLATFQLLRNNLLSFAALTRSITLFAAISTVGMLFPILKAATSGSYLEDVYQIRVFFTHKNFAASALLLALPFLFIQTRSESKTWRTTAQITLALSIIEIALLRTRGVWIGFFAGVGATVFLQLLSKQKNSSTLKWVGIGTGVFAILIAGLFLFGKNAESILNRDNIDIRFKYWNTCVEMAKEQPITGVGAGNWKLNFPKYGLQGTNKSVMEGETNIGRPHNDMLWVLSELGFPGWIALATFQLLLLFICIKLLNHTDGYKRHYAMACIFGLVAFAAYGMGEFPLERPVTVGLMVLLAAEALRLGEEESLLKKPIFTLPATTTKAVLAAIVITGLYIGNERLKGERNAKKALDGYATQNPGKMLKFGEAAKSTFFEVDIYNSPMQYFTGMGYASQRNFDKATQEFKEGLEITPYSINVLFQLGNVYKYQKKFDEALKTYDQALKISPLFYRAKINKVEVYLLQNKNLAALQELNLIPWRIETQKYAQVGVESLIRFANMPDSDFRPDLQAMARKYKNDKPALWQAYIAQKKAAILLENQH